MKKILVIKDPECEVGFNVLTEYCVSVQKYLGNDVQVLPMWPHGEIELIGDKRQMKLIIKTYKEMLSELEKNLDKEDVNTERGNKNE